MRLFRTAVITLLVVLLGVAGYYGYSIYHFAQDGDQESRFAKFNNAEPGGETEPAEQTYEPPKWEGTDRVNILLLGGDSRGLKENEIPRSDTIMIASIDPVTKQAHLLSVLRDTYVKIPGHGSNRINSAVVLGGPKLAMQAVSELTGLKLQYYVYTDFEGFVHLIDEIGGIEFEVEKDMHYTSKADGPEYDIHLEKGLQHMDGRTALQYVRFRHDKLSDFARTERQRKFLTAVAEKMQTTQSIIRLPRILKAIDPYVETNLSITEMIKLGTLAMEARTNEIVGLQLPPSELLREETVDGASVLTVDKAKLQKFIAESFNAAQVKAESEINSNNTATVHEREDGAQENGTKGGS